MQCRDARELISASIDGEANDLERQGAQAHLRGCASCRAYADDLGALPVAAATSTRAELRRDRSAAQMRSFLRLAIATLAFVQLARSLPTMLAHLAGDHTELATHHLVAWDVAFAVGMLVVAAQPFRVRGLLPMAAAIMGVMALTVAIDTIGGHPSGMPAGSHFLQLCGLLLLWRLERVQYPPAHGVTPRWSRRPHPAS